VDNEVQHPELAPTSKKRRRYSAAFKAQILAECDQPDASVAGVAIRHGLNPNMVQKWRLAQRRELQNDFVRLPPPPAPATESARTRDAALTVRMEVPTPAGPVIVHWPVGELPHSIDWLRALTR
jgi:transposase